MTGANEPPTGAFTGLVVADRGGTPLLTITLPGIAVRLLTTTPVLVALAVLHAAAPPDTAWWPSLVVLLLAVASAELPDSGAGLVALAGLAAWWLVAVDEPVAWAALAVGGCAFVFHTALAHAAAGPPGCVPTRAAVARLALRCSAILLATSALAAVVAVAEEWGEPPLLLVSLTLALVGALPWLAARR